MVGFQEADASSWWNGNYSHTNFIGTEAAMNYAVQGCSVDGIGLSYGAAILSNLEINKARQVTFAKSFPTPSKGYVVAECSWPDDQKFTFNVVSVHLDFASPKVRKNQLKHMSKDLSKSKLPLIIMGDFNTDTSSESLTDFIADLNLSTWKKDDLTLISFPTLKKRIDWFFVSKDFTIKEYKVIDEVVSDHKAIKATIIRKSE